MKEIDVRNFFMLTKEEQDRVRFEAGGAGYVVCPHCQGNSGRFRLPCEACFGSGIVHVRHGKYTIYDKGR